jgi:hypothetical protein
MDSDQRIRTLSVSNRFPVKIRGILFEAVVKSIVISDKMLGRVSKMAAARRYLNHSFCAHAPMILSLSGFHRHCVDRKMPRH